MVSTIKNLLIVVLITALGVVGYIAFTKNSPASQQNQSNNSPTTSVSSLNLSGRNLTTFDKNLLDNSSITSFDVSNNRLTGALPAEIRKLTNLEVLNASHNNLTGIPAEIGQLQHLKTADFSYNGISGLPMELGNLRSLVTLDLRGNKNVSTQDLSGIRSKLPNTQILTD